VQKIDQEECVGEGMVLGWWEREEDKATNRYGRRFPPAAATIIPKQQANQNSWRPMYNLVNHLKKQSLITI
jgi:hypothetical protein